MGSANIIDLDAVLEAYDRIAQNDSSGWFLLRYAENSDELYLYTQGTQGLSELKQAFKDLSQVHIAFYREEASQVRTKAGFALINFIPPGISGVRRARALVHSRRVGALFVKTEQATLTIDSLSNLTPSSIHDSVLNPDGVHTIRIEVPSAIERSASSPDPTTPPPEDTMMRRSFTETYNPGQSPPTATPSKTHSLFSTILRRNRKRQPTVSKPLTSDEDSDLDGREGRAPPTPPKDPYSAHIASNGRRRNSLSEFAVISHPVMSDDEVLVEKPYRDYRPRAQTQSHNHLPSTSTSPPYPTSIPLSRKSRKWLPPSERDDAEAAFIQAEEERLAEERLARAAREKAFQEAEAEEREVMKAEALKADLLAARRLKKEREERERLEEEQRRRDLEERKDAGRRRRQAEHARASALRAQISQDSEERRKREADARRKDAEQRRRRVKEAVESVIKEVKSIGWTSAWVTVQVGVPDESTVPVWRRRWIKLIGTKIFLYRSPQDATVVLDQLELKGQLKDLPDPHSSQRFIESGAAAGDGEGIEGFEELIAIPHSFGIEFKDSTRVRWAMFGDTEEEKIKMLGMLHFAAGLPV